MVDKQAVKLGDPLAEFLDMYTEVVYTVRFIQLY